MTRKLYIQTHGCQMNEYDSAKMVDVLRAACGLERTDKPDQADVSGRPDPALRLMLAIFAWLRRAQA